MKHGRMKGVSIMMKNLILVVALAACGNKSNTPIANAGSGSAEEQPAPPPDTRTELVKRRDAACESLGPRITACAVADAKVAAASGKVKQSDYEAMTKPEIQKKNTEEFIKACEQSEYSSRQVRVLEVCQKEESDCEPLLSCLENLNKK
jgi:hypothetical protein